MEQQMAVKLNSSNLKYVYSKYAVNGDSPKFSGKPDILKFNRHEEYEMLPMIEKVMNDLNFSEAGDVHIIEDLIHTKMPSGTTSREEVYDWLINELKKQFE